MSEVHIIYGGNTEDIDLEDLIPADRREVLGIDEGTELTAGNITADQIKNALSNYYDRPLDEFNELVVEHHKNGNITVRPNAVFGVT
jgi:hypothetical protein